MPTATRFLLLISPLRHKLLTQPTLSILTRHHNHLHLTRRYHQHAAVPSNNNSDPTFSPPGTHRFSAWSSFINSLYSQNYFSQWVDTDFVAPDDGNLTDDFVRSVNACFAFAHHRPSILRLLPRRDIEVVVENVRPFLFRSGEESVRRLRGYLYNGQSSGVDTDRAEMIDLMRILLSYMSNPVVSLERISPPISELLEASVQNLLNELARQSHIASNPGHVGSVPNQSSERYAKSPRQFGQNIEMKRGDWICPRCSFMNFARNMKCLECEDARPKRQLTGVEWECPQCGFFNFGNNMACVRCDCKRLGDSSHSSTNFMGGPDYRNVNTVDQSELDRRLAANEEKAQRWFSKISQLDSTSDMSSAIADEDFPDIMPLRKGVNRFVVSTRKTRLERKFSNAMYRRSLGNDGSPEVDVQTEGPNKTTETALGQILDEILGPRSGDAARTNNVLSSSSSSQQEGGSSSTSNYIPSAPVSSEMTAGERNSTNGSTGAGILGNTSQHPENLVRQADNNFVKRDHDGKPEGWLEDIHAVSGVKNVPNYRSDNVTETNPIHEEENRFVAGKLRNLSPTSPMYERHNVMEQASNSSFVPFVPFPPGYFARRDKQPPDGTPSMSRAPDETSNLAVGNKPLVNYNGAGPIPSDERDMQTRNYGHQSTGVLNPGSSGMRPNESELSSSYGNQLSRNSNSQVDRNIPLIGEGTLGNGKESGNMGHSSPGPSENQNIRGSWTGKSLEGSAVKESDPLDMSEEAKAERWFRRVAQIKDISELSQIPDEDFPSIMPMRKGVNRFVVSKRKTPLERRLTSSQYRKNLPIVRSDPLKTESNNKDSENK